MANTPRDQIIEFVKKDLIGPDPSTIDSSLVQENGEEILKVTPLNRYLAGILFSRGYGDKETVPEEDEEEDDIIRLSNASFQSAMGLTVAIKKKDTIRVEVETAFYNPQKQEESNQFLYLREPIKWNSSVSLPKEKNKVFRQEIYNNNSGRRILFDIVCRQINQEYSIYTFTLENACINVPNESSGIYCMFQNYFKIVSELGFANLPDPSKMYFDEDYESNSMLYRNEKSFGVGHGCSASWDKDANTIHEISTTIFPEYEMTPIIPRVFDNVSLDMKKMSKPELFADSLNDLRNLCIEYENWITSLENSDIETRFVSTKNRHIANCRSCLNRMKEGVALLSNNSVVQKAFQYMNEAMLMQQLHFGIPSTQKWAFNHGKPVIINQIKNLPTIDDETTWIGGRTYGKWRPFQLAFVLINLKSMLESDCDERKIVDLIWFPTGGGKTEAYLGLSAYTIFIRRLTSKEDAGTAIIMRYTLRLLTNQQYQRAASLICSIEKIRREKPSELGSSPISIGLWVGGSTTPNKVDEAIGIVNQIEKKELTDNPFIVTKCPWCGCPMGFFEDPDNPQWLKPLGYYISPARPKRFQFKCSNSLCEFNDELPLKVIDETIYKDPPTLLIGTVDKFAGIPFRPEAKSLFGVGSNGEYVNSPPDLIIQDELHLISGPLGTMVGHYESMIEELCTERKGTAVHAPKIIASTATISRAKEQCKALYCRDKDKVFQFPPSGLTYKDSFFAVAGNTDGRKYVGLFCSNLKYSAVTANIRFYADIAFSRKTITASEKELDAYYTHVGYFNSIRELGRMKSYISQEVGEYIKVLDERYGKTEEKTILNDLELTSRIDGGKIPEALDSLSISYMEDPHNVVDVCLATNMISVGVDIPRLGLLSVAGQPKTTSEYIQATSRVGRSSVPGLVFMFYTCSKPRDRSHYEQFQDYHSRIYCYVEPTSVTPFSGPVRERALGALLVSYIRFKHPEIELRKPLELPSDRWFEEFRSLILERVKEIAPEEAQDTNNNINRLIDEWERRKPDCFGSAAGKPKQGQLLSTVGDISESGFIVPTSMRSVDANCTLKELKANYGKKTPRD